MEIKKVNEKDIKANDGIIKLVTHKSHYTQLVITTFTDENIYNLFWNKNKEIENNAKLLTENTQIRFKYYECENVPRVITEFEIVKGINQGENLILNNKVTDEEVLREARVNSYFRHIDDMKKRVYMQNRYVEIRNNKINYFGEPIKYEIADNRSKLIIMQSLLKVVAMNGKKNLTPQQLMDKAKELYQMLMV